MSKRRVTREFDAMDRHGKGVVIVAERDEIDVLGGMVVRRGPWAYCTADGKPVRAGVPGLYAITETGEELRTSDPREPQLDDCF